MGQRRELEFLDFTMTSDLPLEGVTFEAVKEQLELLGHDIPDDVIRAFLKDGSTLTSGLPEEAESTPFLEDPAADLHADAAVEVQLGNLSISSPHKDASSSAKEIAGSKHFSVNTSELARKGPEPQVSKLSNEETMPTDPQSEDCAAVDARGRPHNAENGEADSRQAQSRGHENGLDGSSSDMPVSASDAQHKRLSASTELPDATEVFTAASIDIVYQHKVSLVS